MRDDKNKAYLKAFGENLYKLRTGRDLSYRKMALRCKVDHSDIKMYEQGQTNLTLITLIELAKGLGVEPKELLDF